MAAFLLLPTGADLTLADVETWVARARALGAGDSAPVEVGAPPLAPDDTDEVVLSVPVTVSRTILPGAAPSWQDTEDETAAETESGAASEAVDGAAPEAGGGAADASEAANTAGDEAVDVPHDTGDRSPVGMPPSAVSGAGSVLAS